MKASINKTWLGIGIVTVAMLLASSAATSPAVAATAERALSRTATATDFAAGRQLHPRKPGGSTATVPHYYGRPTDYAPAYPPGPFVLFTPMFD
ncbi:hypothetical protein LQG66_21860 [Bradyrhizobium ontarionense]|uniref:Uncharacterized protein n=1 Tax=Bradyrhizobium ontarionense TaxID=2898149 RepID=A0ABY3R3V9_9BRAD|nr:hypothetical protein [Bradyrhizobium sp. A19]UFZ01956.1 hypothetical protein LQG66_21860 [Bradyrhizobium sp. A19]